MLEGFLAMKLFIVDFYSQEVFLTYCLVFATKTWISQYIPKLYILFSSIKFGLYNSRPRFCCNKKSSSHTILKKKTEMIWDVLFPRLRKGNFRCCWNNFRVLNPLLVSKLGVNVWGVGLQFAGWSCCHGAKLWSTIATQHLENVVNWYEENVGFLLGGDGGVFFFNFLVLVLDVL